MARLVVAGLMGVVIGVIGGAACGLHAQDSDMADAAADAGVDTNDLQAALDTLHDAGFVDVDARNYLVSEGLLAAPTPAVSICDRACARNYIATHSRYPGRALCVAAIESAFDSRAWNPVPWGRWHEHAAGVFGWLQSTARSVGVAIGDIASEVRGFDRMLDLGRGREYAGIAWGRC